MPAPAAATRNARNVPTTLDILGKARWQASKRLPYLSKGMWALTFVVTDQVPTMAIDKWWRCYVNPKHIEECLAESSDAVIAGVVHETLHPTLRHTERGEACKCGDRMHWNTCGDVELNQRIVEAGIRLFSQDVTHTMLGWPANLSAEEYYRLPRKKKDGGGGGGKGDTPCSAGSGANGVVQPWELPGPGQPGASEKTPPGLTPAEASIVRAAVAGAVRDHAQKNGRGSVPAGLLRWAEEMIETPPVDWRALVTARVQYHIDSKRGPVASYARPSRRSSVGGLMLPVHRNPRANVIVVGDTSGSMRETDIGKIIGIVWQAIEALGTVKAIGCDAAATEPVECRHIDDLREALRGGGGTDMSLGIRAAAEHNPDAILVVTDGDTGWPAEQPDVPVVVVLTRHTLSEPPPDWADVIDAT